MLKIFSNMVLAWVGDVTEFQNPLADEQVIYFYQWLRSPRSLFYDPALRRTVQKLMKKVFLKLVDELSHLHVDIIYANFSRLIISTHRIELPEALARVDYFTHLLRTRPGTLFTHMDLQYVTSWRQLMWMDSANYAGVKASVGNLVNGKDIEWGEFSVAQNPSSDSDPDDKENNPIPPNTALPDPELDMQWHLARYLPETRGLRSKFLSLLAGYILAVYTEIRNEHRRLRSATGSQSLESETTPYKSDATASPRVREYQERLLRDHLAPELYNLIMRLQRKAAWVDPESINSGNGKSYTQDKIQRNNEIVTVYLAEKSISTRLDFDGTDNNSTSNHNLILPLLPPHQAILSLEPSTKLQIAGTRRDLLRLINIGEFSPEAVWIAPHMTRISPLDQDVNQNTFGTTAIRSLLIYLPEVACPTCNYTRDIDICRDINVVWIIDSSTNSVNSEVGKEGHWAWVCPHCRTVYPRARLEEALVQQLEQMSLQHCLQDLQCHKCLVGGGIQEQLLANGGSVAQCADCSTKLMLTVPTEHAVYRRLDVYRSIGKHFDFVHRYIHYIIMIQDVSPFVQTILGTGLTWFVTALGSVFCFIISSHSVHLQNQILDGCLGFSAGVSCMIHPFTH
ncbi:unnamed protein product [Trichobilharzia regenti]|nr:unnamed protein product [Trichobilharzia regenti]